MIPINELSAQTGLKITFIRKCLKLLNDVLEPHIQRGNFNSILFSSSAVVIFDKIGQLKQSGLSLPEIRKQLEGTMQTVKNMDIKPVQSPEQTRVNPEGVPPHFIEKFFDLQRELTDEKEKRFREREESSRVIKELEISRERLLGAFKLLPEGKSPEQIKAKWEQEQARKREVAKLIGELKSLGPLSFLKRKKLLARLEALEELQPEQQTGQEHTTTEP